MAERNLDFDKVINRKKGKTGRCAASLGRRHGF